MQVRFGYFYYTIYCDYEELQLEPLILKNYFFYESYFLPKILQKVEPYVLKNKFIHKVYPSNCTAEYPYYYYKNKLFVTFQGKLEPLSTIPKVFNGFVDGDNNIIIDNVVSNFPRPLDIIKIGNNIYKLDNEFTFNYDFATKQIIMYKVTLSI